MTFREQLWLPQARHDSFYRGRQKMYQRNATIPWQEDWHLDVLQGEIEGEESYARADFIARHLSRYHSPITVAERENYVFWLVKTLKLAGRSPKVSWFWFPMAASEAVA
jgi:hypothetical protein